MKKKIIFKIYNTLFNIDYRIHYLINLYIKNIKDCHNCRFFGGCMCNHIDEEGNCLGWENEKWYPFKDWSYHRKIAKMVKIMKKDPWVEQELERMKKIETKN